MLKKHTNSHDAPSRSRVYHVGKERRVATQNANLGMRGCRGREGGSCFLFTSGSEMTRWNAGMQEGEGGGSCFLFTSGSEMTGSPGGMRECRREGGWGGG